MSTKKGNNVKKKLKLTGLLGAALLVLTACGTSQVTAQSTGGWERFVSSLQKPSASCPLAEVSV